MMPQITFHTEAAHSAFHTMCEGMEEVARDDSQESGDEAEGRALHLQDLISLTPAADNQSYPATFEFQNSHQSDIAQTVLENMADSDEESARRLRSISLVRWPDTTSDSLNTREALEQAMSALEARAAETDTASPEGHMVRLALAQIERMLAQRGCEHFDKAGDGTLTDLCDIIIYG